MNTKENIVDSKEPSSLRESIINHLSNEISVLTNLRSNWRMKILSLIYIGPFILLGSVFFGNKEFPMNFKLSPIHWRLLIIAFISWILLGFIAGLIEFGIWKKCNDWRNLILKIASNRIEIKDIDKKDFLHIQKPIPVHVSYLLVYALLALSLFCFIYLVVDIFFLL